MLFLSGHKAPVRALAYSHDGAILASAGDDHTIRLWDRATGESLTRLKGHTDAVRGLAFHPDGKHLYSGSWDGTIICWVADRPNRNRLTQPRDPVWSLAISPDGYDLAFSADKRVRVWRFTDEEPQFDLPGIRYPVTGIAFASGGKHLVGVGQDRRIWLWDAHWGKLLHAVAHPDWLHGLAVAPDSRTIAAACGDGVVRLLDLPSLETQARLVGHRGDVFSVAFFDEGRRLLSAGADGILGVWDVERAQQRTALNLGIGRLYRVAVAPDGMTAAVAGQSNDVVMVDLDFT